MCLIIAFAAISLGVLAEGAVPGVKCPGNYDAGANVVRGRYWYTCMESGDLRPDGCLDPNNKQIKVNEAYVQNGYEMTCYVDEGGDLRFKMTACVIDGKRYLPGESWNEANKFFLTCEQQGPLIYQRVSGCIKDNRRLKLNEQMRYNETLYECQEKSNGAIALCAVGCVYGGRDYLIGATWMDGAFQYNCTTTAGFCHYAQVGCVSDGKAYQNGQTFRTKDGVYRCDASGTKVEPTLMACLSQDGREIKIGERYPQGGKEVICRRNSNGIGYLEPQATNLFSAKFRARFFGN